MIFLKDFHILNPAEREFDFYRGSLLIKDGKIAQIYREPEKPEPAEIQGAEIISGHPSKLIFPGFIQSHIHLCQTLHRNLAEEMPLLQWLTDEVWPYEATLDRKKMGRAVIMGLKEIISSGTTAILDMGTVHEQEVIFEIMGRVGFRYTGGKAMMDKVSNAPEGLKESMDESLDESIRLYEKFHRSHDGLLHYALSPRFLLSCSDELLRQVKIFSDDNDLIIQTHGAEHPDEVETIKKKIGFGNIAYLEKIGALNNNTVITHAVHVDENEKEILQDYAIAVVHCPSTNLKLGSGIAPVNEYLQRGITVGLGTDGAPCNNSHSVFFGMKLASLLQKGINHNPLLFPAEESLRMVSLRGAEIIKMGDTVGSIEEGMDADLAILNMDSPQTYNFEENPAAAIVFGADARNVYATMVRGKFLYREGKFSTTLEALDRSFNSNLRVL
ncbi:MAG: amidohydrolase family protein [Candidatus Aminicenantes bacterium]|nr:amidohydrolase family protein [Candidatus Aminicenantes bacterium]